MTEYEATMARRSEILLRASGLDYDGLEVDGSPAFDYEGLMRGTGYDLDTVTRVQVDAGVGATPMLELPNLTRLVRRMAPPGMGARLLVKDEAANPSGSFKDRRAAVSAHHARRAGFHGLIAATSGNYGAAVASQAARHGLQAIIVQEAFDSLGRGQPEILEKGRKCEALGAEVVQTSVGPELFYVLLRTLEETGYFNASLYTPFSVAGIETLGVEIAEQTRALTGREPDAVLVTHAGGGNVTGVARGLRSAGSDAAVIGVSVDLSGLHMASDGDFNRKSFTTGHTGFAMPFTTWPDRVDVPRNAARPLRYLDRLVTVTQGEVFYVTELLARLEGLERGPAGNTSLAAALALAAGLAEDQVVVISETEYTGAGKSPVPQLEFAGAMGIEVVTGDPADNRPGERIVIPTHPSQLRAVEVDLAAMRSSYLRRALAATPGPLDDDALAFLAADCGGDVETVRAAMAAAA